jgi:putative ABC transport system permease protein
MQRALNEYRSEPLTAIMPGVVLTQLWQLVGVADTALLVVAACVVVAGLVGMLTALLTSLQERRREMAILRSVGARPAHIFSLLILESALLAAAGVALGCLLVWIALVGAGPLLARRFGLFIDSAAPGGYELALGVAVIAAGVLAGLVPAWRAYRNSLADGLSIRL